MAAQKWRPPLSEPGLALWECRKRYVLVHGPRKSGKSLAIADKLVRHAMSWPGSDICILTRTIAKGEAGVWRNLTKPGGVLEKWQAHGLAKYYSKNGKEGGPGYMPSSKVPVIRLSNGPGKPPSTIQMHTLAEDENCEIKFKDYASDFVYVVEADSFDRHVIETMRMTIRSMLVPYHAQQMVLDMNPPPEGKKHWAYKFISSPDPDEIAIQFPLEKNCFISDEEKLGVMAAYAHDINRVKRFYHGEWVEMAENSCFSDVFNENLHVVGEPLGATDGYDVLDERSVLRPWNGAYQLDLGWDIGDKNTAVVLASPRQQDGVMCYDILDEVILLNSFSKIEDFVGMVMKMQQYWSGWLKSENGIHQPMWRHWSDSSSMTQRMALGGSEAQMIYDLSGGTISLHGVSKGRDSISRRRDLLRRLLYENRVAVSSRCVGVLEMLRHLPPKVIKTFRDDLSGKDRVVTDGIDPNSPLRHSADALTYMLSSCVPLDLSAPASAREGSRSMTIEL